MTAVPQAKRRSVLMIAYTNYESDPRVIREAEAAAQAGFSVDFIALRRGVQPAVERVRDVRIFRVAQQRYRGGSTVKYLLAYLEFLIRCFALSARLHVTNWYSVVHVNNMPDLLVFSALVPKVLGAKVILDIHDPMPETFGAKFLGAKGRLLGRVMIWAERLSMAFANATVTVNELVKHGILVARGYRPEKITVVANFADDELFAPTPYPVFDGTLRMVFHGTILERYGLRTLVEALARVKHPTRLQVKIIGEGDFSPQLKELIRARNLESMVEFDNRLYPLREIPGMLAGCHLGLVPLDLTLVAPFALPLKLIEYTCLGLPSITVKSPAISYYLNDDDCFFYDTGDPDALARVIDSVVEHPDRLIEYRKRLEAARPRVSWRSEKEKYVNLLSELSGLPALPNRQVSAAQGTSR